MPQGPIPTLSGLMARTFARIAAAASSLQTALAAAANGQITSPLVGDQNGNLVVSGHGGTASKLAVSNTAGAIIKASPGMICRVVVLVAGAPGFVYDAVATAGLTTASAVATIPATIGPIELDFPCLLGIIVATGAGQQVSVSYQ